MWRVWGGSVGRHISGGRGAELNARLGDCPRLLRPAAALTRSPEPHRSLTGEQGQLSACDSASRWGNILTI